MGKDGVWAPGTTRIHQHWPFCLLCCLYWEHKKAGQEVWRLSLLSIQACPLSLPVICRVLASKGGESRTVLCRCKVMSLPCSCGRLRYLYCSSANPSTYQCVESVEDQSYISECSLHDCVACWVPWRNCYWPVSQEEDGPPKISSGKDTEKIRSSFPIECWWISFVAS